MFTFKGPFLKLGQNIGLFVGAVFWGVGSDIWGRRLSFNLTLFNTGVFSLSGGTSPNSITLCFLAAVWSIGVGASGSLSLPVDSSIFLGMSATAMIDCRWEGVIVDTQQNAAARVVP